MRSHSHKGETHIGRKDDPKHLQHLSYLSHLEAESLFVFREVVCECKKPVLLFSGGKDSATMLWLARKAFFPNPIPFPVLHIDTGHNFPETIEFRDRWIKELGASLLVASVEASIKSGRAQDEAGRFPSRNRLQSITLLDAMNVYGFDAAFGGGRRDEARARAKERFFSLRKSSGGWDPRSQRPEVGQIFNTKLLKDHSLRVFPLNNWTEIDIWLYNAQEKFELPSLYFAHERECFKKDDVLLPVGPYFGPVNGENIFRETVRFRTVGDMTCSAVVPSHAQTVEDIISENLASGVSERASRMDDLKTPWAMEERKREGYF